MTVAAETGYMPVWVVLRRDCTPLRIDSLWDNEATARLRAGELPEAWAVENWHMQAKNFEGLGEQPHADLPTIDEVHWRRSNV